MSGSSHSDWLGHYRLRGRVSPKRAAAAELRARMREAEQNAAELKRERQMVARTAEVQARKAKEAEQRTIRARVGRVAGAVRRIFSRGKV